MYRSIIQTAIILTLVFLSAPVLGQETLATLIHTEEDCDGRAHEGVMYKEVEEMPVLTRCARSNDAHSCTTYDICSGA